MSFSRSYHPLNQPSVLRTIECTFPNFSGRACLYADASDMDYTKGQVAFMNTIDPQYCSIPIPAPVDPVAAAAALCTKTAKPTDPFVILWSQGFGYSPVEDRAYTLPFVYPSNSSFYMRYDWWDSPRLVGLAMGARIHLQFNLNPITTTAPLVQYTLCIQRNTENTYYIAGLSLLQGVVLPPYTPPTMPCALRTYSAHMPTRMLNIYPILVEANRVVVEERNNVYPPNEPLLSSLIQIACTHLDIEVLKVGLGLRTLVRYFLIYVKHVVKNRKALDMVVIIRMDAILQKQQRENNPTRAMEMAKVIPPPVAPLPTGKNPLDELVDVALREITDDDCVLLQHSLNYNKKRKTIETNESN